MTKPTMTVISLSDVRGSMVTLVDEKKWAIMDGAAVEVDIRGHLSGEFKGMLKIDGDICTVYGRDDSYLMFDKHDAMPAPENGMTIVIYVLGVAKEVK